MPITAIPPNDRREQFVATLGQTVFPFDFPIYAAGDLAVYRTRVGVVTPLALTTDYTVTGVESDGGGNVVLNSGSLADDIITIVSAQPIDREDQLADGRGLQAEVWNRNFNRTMIALQQIHTQAQRTFHLPDSDGVMNLAIPPAAERAGAVLGFNLSGEAIAVMAGIGGSPVTPFIAELLDDVDPDEAHATLQINRVLDFFIGMSFEWNGSALPTGFLWEDGANHSRTTYAKLFARIGTTHGAGDGSTTFGVPDSRGRMRLGRDNMGGAAANRVTAGIAGLAATVLGAAGGDQRMPQHGHGLTDLGHFHNNTPSGGNIAYANNSTLFIYPTGGGSGNYIGYGPINNTGVAGTGISIQSAGSGTGANIPPAIVKNVVIFAGV